MAGRSVRCWCGAEAVTPTPHPDYVWCGGCGTACYAGPPPILTPPAGDGEAFLYGESYWYEHQSELGFPDIRARARLDLRERCQHWLSALLSFRLPPADVLEIGCAHGAFLKLLSSAGFTASGVELSPSIVAFGKRLFSVDVREGAIEEGSWSPASFDVVCSFDVLEHLPNPEVTLRHAAGLLRTDGLLLVQTPVARAIWSEAWMQYCLPEHLFLYSEASLRVLLARCGFGWVHLLPALSEEDGLVVASRQPLTRQTPEEIEVALQSTPDGRLVLALQDLYSEALELRKRGEEPYISVPEASVRLARRVAAALGRRLLPGHRG